jgi:hypothetical protein
MPKHSGKGGFNKQSRKNPKEPSEQYNELCYAHKFICFKYWQNLLNPKEGWDRNRVGSVDHYRSTKYILDNLRSDSVFRHRAKTMLTLAEALKEQNIQLIEPALPLLPDIDVTATPAVTPPPPITKKSVATNSPQTTSKSPSPTLHHRISKSNNRSSPYPSPRKMSYQTPPRDRSLMSPGGTLSTREDISCAGTNEEIPLGVPTTSGYYRKTSFVNGQYKGRVTTFEIRFLVDNFAKPDDFEFTLLEPDYRKMKITRKQPRFITHPMEMEDWIVDEGKVPIHDRDGELLANMAESQGEKLDENGSIYSVGVYIFDQQMDPDSVEATIETVLFEEEQGSALRVVIQQAKIVAKKGPVRAKKGKFQGKTGKADVWNESSDNDEMDFVDAEETAYQSPRKKKSERKTHEYLSSFLPKDAESNKIIALSVDPAAEYDPLL